MVANSWQQTPAGYHIVGEGMNARAEITDFWAMVFNPSSVDRLLHVWIGAFLAGAFLVMSVNAYYIIKKKHLEIARPSFKIALLVATFFRLHSYLLVTAVLKGWQNISRPNWPPWRGIMIPAQPQICFCWDG